LLTIASPSGLGVERFADQVVDDARAVVLGRVDVIDMGHGALSFKEWN
jgi:hypothetical protein